MEPSSPLAAQSIDQVQRAPQVSLGTLVSRMFGVWKGNVGTFAAVSLAFQVPILLAYAAVGSPLLAHPGRFGQVPPETQAFVMTGRYWAIMAVSLLLVIVQAGALSAGALEHLAGRRAAAGAMIGRALRLAGPLLASNLLALLAIWIGFILLIVPGVILTLMFSLMVPIVVAEALPWTRVMGRSRSLTKGHRWKLLGLFVIGYLVALAPTLLVSTLAPDVPYLATVLNLILGVLVMPLLMAAPAVAYHDLRNLKDGANTAQLERVFE
jgi:hypothetical protein